MKVLSILNLSNRENVGSDSGVIFHRLLFGELARRGWDCTIAAPLPLNISGTRDILLEVGRSKYDVRFRFDWDAVENAVRSVDPDLIFVHQVELVPEYKALLVTLGHKAKIATYCHYWPIIQIASDIEWDASLNHGNLAQVLLFRILSAATIADYFFVTSQYAHSLLRQAAQRYNVSISSKRTYVLPCPADPAFLSNEPRIFKNSRKILYNHRLYKQYGTDFLLELITYFSGADVTFVITDLHAASSSTRRSLDPYVDAYRKKLNKLSNVQIRTDGGLRQIYKNEIVDSVDICLARYRVNANWSMGAIDCMGMGIPAICPNVASFPEFTPEPLLFTSKPEAIALLERLFTDHEFWIQCSTLARQNAEQFRATTVCDMFTGYLGADHDDK